MKYIRALLLPFLALLQTLFAKPPPPLQQEDVAQILGEIFSAHATFHEISPLIMQRACANYIEAMDPFKTYLLKSQVSPWLQACDADLQKWTQDFKNNDFSLFEKIHEEMVKAIERRRVFEERLPNEELIKNVQASEFKDCSWAETSEELYQRLLHIRSLQTDTAEKVCADEQDKILQRLAKRRQKAEEEILAKSEIDKKRVLYSNIIKAIASSLDSHTVYFTPFEAAQFMIQMQQRLFGIGVQIRDDLNGFTIVRVVEGSPTAQDNTLHPKDRIVAVDNETVVGLDIEDVIELIRGPEGTFVKITALRSNEGAEETVVATIERKEIVIKEARYEIAKEPFADGVIAHLTLYSFYQDPQHSSASDLHQAISALKKEDRLKGIILDLRSNAGGILPQAVAVTGLFINKGIVASIKESSGAVQHLRDVEGNPVWEGPLLVMLSKHSASAAEIVAQTLQDYGRALVVGDAFSFGKGTFQTFTLDSSPQATINPRGEFKVTRGRYYTVSGKSPQLVGVRADIPLPGIFSYAEIGERYAKYPLDNDEIPAHFEDELEDIPFFSRKKVSWLYKCNLQQKISLYTQYLDVLKKNSAQRIEGNKAYQKFLQDVKKWSENAEPENSTYLTDFQYEEAVQVMKDLLALMH